MMRSWKTNCAWGTGAPRVATCCLLLLAVGGVHAQSWQSPEKLRKPRQRPESEMYGHQPTPAPDLITTPSLTMPLPDMELSPPPALSATPPTGGVMVNGANVVRAAAPMGAGELPPDVGQQLKSQFEQLLLAVGQGDTASVAAAGAKMVLPDPETWFTATFGSDKAVALCRDYAQVRQLLENGFVDMLKTQHAKGQTVVNVVPIRSPMDRSANAHQKAALQAMKRPVPLYSVRLSKAGGRGGFEISSFVYVAGAFRFVSKLAPIGGAAPPREKKPAREKASKAGPATAPEATPVVAVPGQNQQMPAVVSPTR